MPDKIFVDTNILVYLSNQASPFHTDALKAFADIRNNFDLWISRQILREFAVVVSKPDFSEHPADSNSVTTALKKWAVLFSVADETEEVTNNLIQLISTYDIKGKRIHDANIVATMMAYEISDLLTMNVDDFKNFKEIKLKSISL